MSDALDIRLETRGTWGENVLGRIHVTNTTDAAIEDWTLLLDAHGLDFTAFHKVAGTIAADGTAEIRAADWMGALAAGETLSFGFDARTTDDHGLSVVEAALEGPPLVPSLTWAGGALGGGEIVLGATDGADPDGALELLDYDVWGDTFVLRLSVTNTTDAAIDDWMLMLDGTGFDILSVGPEGSWTSTDGGDTARFHAPGWNDALDAGETARFTLRGQLSEDWDLA